MSVAISIDGRRYEVETGDGKNLLEVALSLGFDLPYFCWHPALGSVGACRQCAVRQFRDDADTRGRLQMACMIPVSNGLRVSIDDAEANNFRRMVCEWLMVNHPHDCPVCDEGGECHLQDMTVMTGQVHRRYPANKRTFENQYLGPFVNHEMNRCIQCYRCVRFYRDYANGKDLRAHSIRNQVYFGRDRDGVLESPFAGNLVEVCPTGVFTDKTLKQHYTRKWDLQTAPSVCVHCGLGCNTIPGERYGQLRRIRNRYHHEVNGYFLCDRGRYGYEFVNGERRIRQAMVNGQPATVEAALARVAELFAGGRVIGIGSPRASLEANFALMSLVGPERFYRGLSSADDDLTGLVADLLRTTPAGQASLRDVRESDAALVLGEDPTQTAPMLSLALRQTACRSAIKMARRVGVEPWDAAALRFSIEQCRGPLNIVTPYATGLDDRATGIWHVAPDDIARLGFAAAHCLDPQAPLPSGVSDEEMARAHSIAADLRQSESPVVVSGTSCGSAAILEAAANVACALRKIGKEEAKVMFAVGECNSLGLRLMGGRGLADAFEAEAEAVIVLENDLHRRLEDDAMGRLLQGRKVVVLDHLWNATTEQADVVLPAATFAETDGTLVNNEGRAQRFYRVMVPGGQVQASWRWLRDVAKAVGQDSRWPNLDALQASLAASLPQFEPVTRLAPPAGFRAAGQRIPRQSARYSGRTAMHANVSVHEPQPPEDIDSPLAFSMEGYDLQPPAALIPRYWSPGWNSVQSLNKFQEEVGGPLRGGDPGKRLIQSEAADSYFSAIPAAFQASSDVWLVVPHPHLFGSEELSIHTPGVAELAGQAYIGLNDEAAQRLSVHEGQELELQPIDGGAPQHLPYRPVPSLPNGVAAIPTGLPGLTGISLPAWYRIRVA